MRHAATDANAIIAIHTPFLLAAHVLSLSCRSPGDFSKSSRNSPMVPRFFGLWDMATFGDWEFF